MENLNAKKCVACGGAVRPLKGSQIDEYISQLDGWRVVEEHHLLKSYKFKDFKSALDFVNKVGAIAEEEGHHPNICFTYGKVSIELYTHAIDGLFINDFILAAKIDKLKSSLYKK